MSETHSLKNAELSWDGNTPRSKHFDDIYFSPENGLAESRYVFLQHNHLDERWSNLKDTDHFVIMETGFGTGLNFLASWQLWTETGKKKSCCTSGKNPDLHFISFEKFPLEKSQLLKAYQAFPELDYYTQQLLHAYPKKINGFHRLHFENNVHLTLIFDDALGALEKITRNCKADAWFFDGFSPDNNPELWSEDFFNASKTLNKNGSTFATFTSAGHVKRKLQHIGFECKKVKGFLHKREMLTGVFNEKQKAQIPSYPYQQKPWLITPFKKSIKAQQKIAIIGSGLAGAWTAYKLAEKGLPVCVFDGANEIASAASGNSRGATYFKLEKDSGKADSQHVAQSFYLHAYLYAVRELNRLFPCNPEIWHSSGLIQLLTENNHAGILKNNPLQEIASFISQKKVGELSESTQSCDGIYFPDAGSINPKLLCRYLLDHPKIQVHLSQNIETLDYHDDSQLWSINTQQSNAFNNFSALVLANSHAANNFLQTNSLPLFKVRGQSTQIKATDKSASLKTVICAKGYLTPSFDGAHTIGSTFDPRNQDTEVTNADNQANLVYLKSTCPDFYRSLDPIVIENAKAALRCQTPDMLPMLGQVCDYQSFMHDYADIAKGQLKKSYPLTQYFPNLYINSAHASRGLISTPYCAEILTNEIANEPLPCEKDIKDALSPTRFYLRQLKRK